MNKRGLDLFEDCNFSLGRFFVPRSFKIIYLRNQIFDVQMFLNKKNYHLKSTSVSTSLATVPFVFLFTRSVSASISTGIFLGNSSSCVAHMVNVMLMPLHSSRGRFTDASSANLPKVRGAKGKVG
jgi:hypothetical protein